MGALALGISFIISIYSMLIIARIILSWVNLEESQFSQAYQTLCSITDPFLRIFRSIPGLTRGSFDFSPLIALITLGIINTIISTMMRQGQISLGIVLGIILQSAWAVVSFFLLLYIILVIFRLVLDYRSTQGQNPYAPVIDSLIQWPVDIALRLFFQGRSISIRQGLFGALLLLIGIRFAGRIIVSWLAGILISLPI